MGRKPINDGLDVFKHWLVVNELLSPATARSYTSHVRSALRGLEGSLESEQAVADFFDNLYENNPFTYANAKRGWMLFRAWVEETTGKTLPVPGGEKSKRRNTLPPLPDTAQDALAQLLRDTSIALIHIPHLSWSDVHLRDDRSNLAEVRVPGKVGEYWQIDRDVLVPLRDFAQSGDTAVPSPHPQPLIPSSPGSLIPYSYRGLRREVVRARSRRARQMVPRLVRNVPGARNQPAYLRPLPPEPVEVKPVEVKPTEDDFYREKGQDTHDAPPGMIKGQEPDWWKRLSGMVSDDSEGEN